MDLTKDNVTTLIKKIAVPASIGTFFQTMYNLVDSKFAGLISAEALTAIVKSFPIYLIIIAASVGISAGTTALISNTLGKKDNEKASVLFAQSILVALLITLIVTFIGIISMKEILEILKSNEQIISYALDYMKIIFSGSIIIFLLVTMNAFLVSRGDTKSYRNVLIFSFFLNIFLNPLFIYGFFVVPAMGISGIALATIVSELVGLIYIIYKLNKTEIRKYISLECFKPKKDLILDILRQAIPSGLSMGMVGLGVFILIYLVSSYGEYSAGGYGTGVRFEQLFLLPILGLNTATLSLVGQNFGANNLERIREIYLLTLKYGVGLMIIGGMIIFTSSPYVMSFFSSNIDIIYYGTAYLKIAAIAGPCYPVFYISSALLQGLQKPTHAMIINLLRMIFIPLVILAPAVLIFSISYIEMFTYLLIINYAFALMIFIYCKKKINKIINSYNPNFSAV
jgi:putative MATE family efflux protein